MKNHLWAIVGIREFISNRSHRKVYQIDFVGVQDRQSYKTFVDPKNKNYKYWMKYIATPNKAYIVSGLETKDDPYLINADKAPKIEITYNSAQDMADELEDIWVSLKAA